MGMSTLTDACKLINDVPQTRFPLHIHLLQIFISLTGMLDKHPNVFFDLIQNNWPVGTLPFGIFWSNLDTMDLETYPRTYSGQFLTCVTF